MVVLKYEADKTLRVTHPKRQVKCFNFSVPHFRPLLLPPCRPFLDMLTFPKACSAIELFKKL